VHVIHSSARRILLWTHSPTMPSLLPPLFSWSFSILPRPFPDPVRRSSEECCENSAIGPGRQIHFGVKRTDFTHMNLLFTEKNGSSRKTAITFHALVYHWRIIFDLKTPSRLRSPLIIHDVHIIHIIVILRCDIVTVSWSTFIVSYKNNMFLYRSALAKTFNVRNCLLSNRDTACSIF